MSLILTVIKNRISKPGGGLKKNGRPCRTRPSPDSAVRRSFAQARAQEDLARTDHPEDDVPPSYSSARGQSKPNRHSKNHQQQAVAVPHERHQ